MIKIQELFFDLYHYYSNVHMFIYLFLKKNGTFSPHCAKNIPFVSYKRVICLSALALTIVCIWSMLTVIVLTKKGVLHFLGFTICIKH